MTDLAAPTTVAAPPAPVRALPTLATGVLGGLALGVIGRWWMRLIAEDPEFSWNGTIFIVAGFTIFGLTQATALLIRSRARRRWSVVVARVIGTIGMLPLFGAAGAQMMPTVIAGGFAFARVEWSKATRLVCLLIAVLPVAYVTTTLVGTFGWSPGSSTLGFALLLAVYGVVIWAARPTFAAAPRGLELGPRATTVLFVVMALGLGALLAASGIT